MADIIDFRARAKPLCSLKKIDKNNIENGKIILFSGVRIERDVELKTNSIKTNETVFLTTKTR